MILISDTQRLARERQSDAEALNAAGRLDGCVYLCGYCVEIALKARICQTLDWAGFPDTAGEFHSYKSFQTHDLNVLLHLSGVEATITAKHYAAWSVMAKWDPNTRYRPSGTLNAQHAEAMLTAVRELMSAL